MKKKILLWLFRKNPQEISDILLEDFIGIIPKSPVDKSAMDFLARNRSVFETWLLRLGYVLQKENITQAENLHRNEFYKGALFTIRLLYSITNRDLPVEFTPDNKPKDIKDPQAEVDNFLAGMESKKNGQKESNLPQGQAGKV